MTLPLLSNTDARRLFLHLHALTEHSGPGKGADLLDLIRRLGFVQIDSINTVERAHHMILHARRPSYRPEALARLAERDRSLFEHWTHDAALIPTEFYPHWQLRFRRSEARARQRWTKWHGRDFDREAGAVLEHIARHGASGTSEVGQDEARSSGGWWEWNPSKTALEFLWMSGRLAISRRESFRKIYDLTERVIPEPHRAAPWDEAQTIAWAANAALDRLGFATTGEIAAFFAKITPDEAKAWAQGALQRGEVIEVEVQGHDGARRRSLARPDVLAAAAAAPEPTGAIRILSPFDPALRDRARAERLFGFAYRIEVFVPAPQRRYGYYVFPVLEGSRLIGRIDMKAERGGRQNPGRQPPDRQNPGGRNPGLGNPGSQTSGRLNVTAFWPEPGIRLTAQRLARLETALARSAGLAGTAEVAFAPGWQRETLG